MVSLRCSKDGTLATAGSLLISTTCCTCATSASVLHTDRSPEVAINPPIALLVVGGNALYELGNEFGPLYISWLAIYGGPLPISIMVVDKGCLDRIEDL